MTNFSQVVETARDAFNRHVTKSLEFRVAQLKALYRMYDENTNELVQAVSTDLRKPFLEALLIEVEATKNEIKGVLYAIHKWVQPQPTETNLVLLLDKTFIYPEPYGVVLILGAWNYPLTLVTSPMLGAIAAGNCVIVKPSEKAPATAKLLFQLIPKYLDPECFQVVCGGLEETTELLKERFDYIFYTGSPQIGQKIRDAANKHLTPCTLELGGKSPVYIDDNVDIELACRRIIWGKMLNLGQTCVAPDYILCSKAVEQAFVEKAKEMLLEFFGSDPKESPDLARIVNEQHFKRIIKFLECGKIALGGTYDASQLYISPTILTDVKQSDSVMQEEIFGPVLPIITINSPEQAIDFINKREKPLTLYLFSTNKNLLSKFLTSTSSGSMCVNDTIVHLSVDTLPFGGVGKSGMGTYHGKYSFDTFSHKKSVLVRSFNSFGEFLGKFRYPPYSDRKVKILKQCLVKRPTLIPPSFKYFAVFALGMLCTVLISKLLSVSGFSDDPASVLSVTINQPPNTFSM